MNCFVHNDTAAVATCKHCGKGLCATCCVVASGGVSCRGACEGMVEAMRELTARA